MGSLNPAELEASVRALLAASQKIAAVKLYREQTGLGLAESKQAVEACERGGPLPQPGAAGSPSSFGPPASPPTAGASDQEVLALLQAGHKIEAIKVYRQATGRGLKEAKEAVEALARRHGIDAGGGGCLGVLLAFAACGAGLASLAALFATT